MNSRTDRGETCFSSALLGVFRARLLALLSLALSTAVAQAAPFAYITNAGDDTVSVVDTATNTVVATVDVGNGPQAVAVTADGSRVYVTNRGDYTVSVIRTSDNVVIATVPVPEPLGVAVTPDGSRVYVTGVGQVVSVIDTGTNTVVATVDVGDFFPDATEGVAVSPDGTRVYVATIENLGVAPPNLVVIDTATNMVVDNVELPLNDPVGVAVTPSGRFVYVAFRPTSVLVIDALTNTLVATVGVGNRPERVAVTPNGCHVYVTNNIDGTVSVIRTADNTVIDTVSGFSSPDGVDVTPDGAHVYVANVTSNSVSVIDTANNTVTTTVTVGDHPIASGKFISGPITIWGVITLFDDAVADGTLEGQGPGRSAQERLNTMRNMLVESADLLFQGDVEAARVQLQDAADRTDGRSSPTDFVQGQAADDLFDAILAVAGQLGCDGGAV